MTPTLTHRDDCPNPATPLQAFMGRMGDPMLTCPACKAWKVARKAEAAPAPVAEPSARYVCREHGHRVNWRGRGCPRCIEFLAMTPAERRRATKADW